ncbi:arsenosugar biosynthesis radical SAM (seleno)protein ArsS [Roseimaritima sediminicola]|uniref:arsenosugar biosynthesis radical SAM (seleno)protein ArsS n=1 Tax=Roseimaritima sediminicola TaxID=2662066 RepID=UPI0012983B14|nr:arsenosugar biosynthesis radical SAM (seleno)protein ArsS [Roseimaritima sediminicola]
MLPTLQRRQAELASAAHQRRTLEAPLAEGTIPHFSQSLRTHRLPELSARAIEVLQVNVGKVCNQTCSHCHVDAGPERQEKMSLETARAVIDVLAHSDVHTLDITGGAPEMNPHFRFLVRETRALGRRVIDRCNLTILMANGFRDLPEFLAENEVDIVASLPCYLEDNCDAQRGDGVFQRSIAALQRLNALGYGQDPTAHPGRNLTLVYNPTGPTLPPEEQQLQATYRRELKSRYGIEFTALHAITNLPISRFLDDLLSRGRLEEYLRVLVEHFNPETVGGVMCRSMLSVDWRGRLFDCDFNQMLDLELAQGLPRTIFDLDLSDPDQLRRITSRAIVTGRHCYGCTAGCGSSCQGAVVKPT